MAFWDISDYTISKSDIVNFNVKALNKTLKRMNVSKEERNEIKNLRRTERAKMYDTSKREGIVREIRRLENTKRCLQEELEQIRSECYSLNEMADYLVRIL